MNILIIGTTDIVGGAARISWDIKNAGTHKVTMFVADKHSDDSNVRVIPRVFWRKLLDFMLATDDFVSTDWILNTPEFKEADIIHCHNLHGRFFNLSTLQKMSVIKPVVWTLHDEWAITAHCACTFEGKEIRNGLYVCPSIDTPPRLLWDNTERLAKKKNGIYSKLNVNIVVPSKWLESRVKNTALAKNNIIHIPNGIDTSVFRKLDKLGKKTAREKLGLPQDKKIVLFLADDAKKNIWKGWEYTQKVIEKYETDNRVLFLNVGNRSGASDEPESNVKHVGYIDNDETLALYYNASDVLLFTSIAENFPLVILEAMACGLPIVSFDVGGVKEVLEHKVNGYIARYRDSHDLVVGLKWLMGQTEANLETMSDRSSRKIKSSYTKEKMLAEYFKLYEDIRRK